MMATNEEITGPINLGSPNEFTIKQLAEKVVELTNSSAEIVYKSLPQDDPRHRCPDIGKASDILDWEPSIQLTEGLTQTINYFSNLLEQHPDL